MELCGILCLIKWIGYIKLVEIAYRFMLFVQRRLRYGKIEHLTETYGKGSYALVTGGTDGVGLEFCKILAGLGFNLVIVSRTQSKLEDVKASI